MLGDRWGVSDGETLRRYPCDDFVPAPTLRAWRGVSVDAPPAAVWQWVGQIRLAPYSYDWIDNLGRRSPQLLVGLPEPVVGEPFTTAGGRRRGRILAVEPGRHLTGRIMGAVLSYVLVPDAGNTTRLLLKVVMRTNPVIALGGCLGDLVMARRQLLNLKRLAEQDADR
ncbi:SRPBCC family protein [Micromonospora tulbaghiae]|uniref:Polyketide cyclase / dehydrase and lipid transport n=1 Tax=Micromonospora tulbaghiae TaxID=479978 RepID=A0ABY0KJZ5_9ACTN|nr:SRPBCC family protein [Micromonospora tulbaghiae]MDX5459446.1 SRPBCC family protein [Micromonospora tulbaghiae]SCE82144.1 Polyketide cyclase / dehydrase and lipid transport [Micromonospora tulbaghiae]